MPIIIRKTTASLQGVCTVEDAEPLLKWLLAHPGGKVQMKECLNLHSAVLQTLVAGQAQCLSWPADTNLRAWLEAALDATPDTVPDAAPDTAPDAALETALL